jgi:hypothetical protein
MLRAAREARKNGELDRASRLEMASAQHFHDAAVVEVADKRLKEKRAASTDHSRTLVLNFAAVKRSIMSHRRSRR